MASEKITKDKDAHDTSGEIVVEKNSVEGVLGLIDDSTNHDDELQALKKEVCYAFNAAIVNTIEGRETAKIVTKLQLRLQRLECQDMLKGVSESNFSVTIDKIRGILAEIEVREPTEKVVVEVNAKENKSEPLMQNPSSLKRNRGSLRLVWSN